MQRLQHSRQMIVPKRPKELALSPACVLPTYCPVTLRYMHQPQHTPGSVSGGAVELLVDATPCTHKYTLVRVRRYLAPTQFSSAAEAELGDCTRSGRKMFTAKNSRPGADLINAASANSTC